MNFEEKSTMNKENLRMFCKSNKKNEIKLHKNEKKDQTKL